MRAIRAFVAVLVLVGTIAAGCLSITNSGESPSHTTESLRADILNNTGEASPVTAVGTAEINGTFYGWLTAPMPVFDDVQRLLEGMNATLYAFKVKVIGKNLNASITIYALKLVPPFVPENFSVVINAKPLEGAVFVPYADTIPVSVEMGGGNRGVKTTSYLKVRPTGVERMMGVWDSEKLDKMNGSVIMRLDNLELKVIVRKPGDYLFTVPYNGSEISSGGLEVE